MDKIFRQLYENLDKGCQTVLVSEYNASGIHRSLICADDYETDKSLHHNEKGLCLANNENGFTMVEYYSPKPRMIILGGGHIAQPLSQIGKSLGFCVTVFDDRPLFANNSRFPKADVVICDSFDNLAECIKISRNDYVIIVTRGHRHDEDCLRCILMGEYPRYLGMIGSKRRVAIVKKQLQKETGQTEQLARLHAPIGLPIGAVTPEEIAISILSEVICDLRLGTTDSSSYSVQPWEFINPDMELIEWLKMNTQSAALVTVVSTEGSTPRETGAKMAVLQHGQIFGSIGGGCAEADVIRKALNIVKGGGFCLLDIDMNDVAEDNGMVCGGSMKVLIERIGN